MLFNHYENTYALFIKSYIIKSVQSCINKMKTKRLEVNLEK